MYFNQTPQFNFKEHFNTDIPFYAHLREINQTVAYERLEDHINLTMDYCAQLCVEKNLNQVLDHFETELVGAYSLPVKLLWRELLYNTLSMHDVGKTNPNFQYQKMKNSAHTPTQTNNSNHSYLSSLIYSNHYLNKVFEFSGKERDILFFTLIFNAYIISKHHGYLKDFQAFLEKICNDLIAEKPEDAIFYRESFGQITTTQGIFQRYHDQILADLKINALWKSIPWIIYGRFLFGLLVSGDFYATSDFMHAPIPHFGTIKAVNKYRLAFNQSPIVKSIRNHQLNKKNSSKKPATEIDINYLRSELFLEAEEALLKNADHSLFFFEAPTGSGKTNTSINLALTLLELDPKLNKITYVFPFNTLVEQTKSSLINAFNGDPLILDDITVVNSVTPIKEFNTAANITDGEWDETNVNAQTDYENTLLARQFLHYPIVLTTHVNFFATLFGTNREAVFPLAHLANSVIILDEIQSYPNHLWKEIILFLQEYAKLLNMRVIIMSATLPDLAQLSLKNAAPIPRLIKDPNRYYQHPLFKNRVDLDFSLLANDKETILDVLLEKITKISIDITTNPKFVGFENKILVEFINKSTALDFFTRLNDYLSTQEIIRDVLCITGDDNKAERKRIIEKVKRGKNLILVATQVIEAGVDIDMDIGFKDISLFDAEEQFLGRINRSCKKEGSTVFFFNYDNAAILYRNDFRKQDTLTIKEPAMQTLLANKNFGAFYKIILNEINNSKNACNDANIEKFARETLWNLDYFTLQNHMKLIDDRRQEVSLFIYEDPLYIDGELIDSLALWNHYLALLRDNTLDYAKKRVLLSRFCEKMDYFIYQIPHFSFDNDGQIGDLFLCKREDAFFPNGKFDRTAFYNFKNNNLFL